MKTKVNPALVGVFVLGAFGLALIALLSFGGVNFLSKPERFVVFFDETVHGLDLGSPVKIRGVRVGRVVEIQMRYSADKGESVVAVVCELTRSVIADAEGELVDVTSRGKVEQLVEDGMRAQLGVVGLATGMLYVELNFFEPSEADLLQGERFVSRYLEVPARRSTISQFQANFTELLDNIREIDFAAVVTEAQGTLADFRQVMAAADVPGLTAEWKQLGKAGREFLESPELKKSVVGIGDAIDSFNRILADFEENGPKGEEWKATLNDAAAAVKEAAETLAVLRNFLNAQQSLGDEAVRALARMGEAAAAVQALADYLERNPAALLTGRRPPVDQP